MEAIGKCGTLGEELTLSLTVWTLVDCASGTSRDPRERRGEVRRGRWRARKGEFESVWVQGSTTTPAADLGTTPPTPPVQLTGFGGGQGRWRRVEGERSWSRSSKKQRKEWRKENALVNCGACGCGCGKRVYIRTTMGTSVRFLPRG